MLTDLDESSRLSDFRAELALAQKLARIGVWRWDLRRGRLDWSDATFRIFGWPEERDAPSPAEFFALLSPESAAEIQAAGERAIEGRATRAVDLQLAGGPDASWVTAMLEPVRDARGEIIGLRGIVQDITERKRQEQRARFHAALLDAVGQAVIATAPDGRILYWNAGAEELYGWPREEAIGQLVNDLTPTEMSREQATEIFAALTAGRAWSGDFQVRRKDGSAFIADVHDDPVMDASGRLVAVIGVSTDISERRAAEAEQRRLREELDRAQDIARLGSWAMDSRTGNVTWSDAMYVLMRRDRALGPTRGDEGFAAFTPESADRLREAFLGALKGRPFQLELERADMGAWFVAQGEPMHDGAGAHVGIRGILRDITAERRVREALRASEHRLLEAQNAARIGNWERDLRTNAMSWSRQMYDLVGRDRALGPPRREEALALFTEETARELVALGERAAQTGLPYMVDVELRQPSPSGCRYMSITGEVVRAPDGAIIGLRGTAQDITARRQAQDALVRAEQLTTLGTLVAGVAHEINNPLTYIRGNIEIIQDVTDDPEIQTAAHIALEGLDRIGAITQGLRMVARPSVGARAETDVNKLVRDIVPVARPRLGPAVEVTLALEAGRRAVVDANQLGQVILNLLFNAGDAMRAQPDARVTVRTRDVDGGLEIEVADTGPGIPPEVERRLFTPFFTTKAEGTGLGLSVSQAIVKAHDGTLTVQTRVGEGSTFRIHLPAQDDQKVTPWMTTKTSAERSSSSTTSPRS